MKKGVLILGATSAIVRASAAAFARRGHPLFLAARDLEELPRIAADLQIRYQVPVHSDYFDAEKYEEHSSFLQRVVRECGELDGVLLGFGDMGDGNAARLDFSAARPILERNYVGACSILSHCADYFAEKGTGFIAGIASVAGDRGRQSNYVYGSAKGALALYLQGMRNWLYHHGVHVMTIKPGFVDTAMTYGLPGLFLVASPETIGEQIVQSIEKKRDIVYLPRFWSGIMAIIKAIPEKLFKRLQL